MTSPKGCDSLTLLKNLVDMLASCVCNSRSGRLLGLFTVSVESQRAVDGDAPSAESERLDTYVEAFLAVMPRRVGKRFLREVEAILAAKAGLSQVTPIKNSSEYAVVSRARIGARVLHVRRLPTFIARLARR